MPPEPLDTMVPWTIRAVPTATRDAITKAARLEDLTVGQWLEKRVAEWLADGSPTALPTPSDTGDRVTTDQLIEVAKIAAALRTAGQKGLSQAVLSAGKLLDERIRASAGLPAREADRPRSPPRLAAPSSAPSDEAGAPPAEPGKARALPGG